MKAFQDLVIHLNSVSVPDFIAYLGQKAAGGWQRDEAAEQRLRAVTGIPRTQFCFALQGNADYSPVSLWLTKKEPDRLCVANILSEKKDALTYDEYNALLDSFYQHAVAPAAAECGATVAISSPDVSLGDFLPQDLAEKLRQFSAVANKATGSVHPQDLQRWLDFLTEVHQRSCELPPDLLGRWLEEEEHWPAETTRQLLEEYEFARALLSAYDRKRAG
jgi:hypothetical protein